MNLRNKKTGEIKSIEEIIREAFLTNELDSLKNIDDNWEDVDGTNDTNIPLIEDEEVRKVVREWANLNNLDRDFTLKYESSVFALKSWQAKIEFNFPIKGLEDKKIYTITELCGEEEE